MREQRHALLGCQFHYEPRKILEAIDDGFRGMGNYGPPFSGQAVRKGDVSEALALAVMYHLGFELPPRIVRAAGPDGTTKMSRRVVDIERRIHDGFDVALDYFFGNWWLGKEVDRMMIDKQYPNRELVWFKTFSQGLLLGLLTERWAEISKLCSWIDADLQPEYMGGDIELEVCQLYMVIAAHLRPEPMKGLDELETSIRKCTTTRPALLFQVWDAVLRRDQTAFDRALLKSLEEFARTYFSAETVVDWVAVHQSVIWLVAKHFGLHFPPLPERFAAMIISRESLGLGTIQ